MELGTKITGWLLKAPDPVFVVVAIAALSAVVAIFTSNPISGMAAAISLLYLLVLFVWAVLAFALNYRNRTKEEEEKP